jgi:hypothetical protein
MGKTSASISRNFSRNLLVLTTFRGQRDFVA